MTGVTVTAFQSNFEVRHISIYITLFHALGKLPLTKEFPEEYFASDVIAGKKG